ncbi:HNH endonuclease family protein [Arthrobacter sp. NPDC093125]|uniref:HNH endonuclease family protein n=1 Tax=Arthrobacter sp. NPDC093125 TaxID=3363944 RepID=UPI003822A6FA
MEKPAASRTTIKIIRSAAIALTAVTALLLGASLAGCDATANALEVVNSAPAIATGAPAPGDAISSLEQLKSVPVKGRAPKTGYTREEFGPAWADVDRNGCDTRDDILARDLSNETFKPGTNNCVVATGTLADKYIGTAINFIRGQDTSSDVQIDHIVPLSDAWQKGAQQLA